MRLIHYFFTLVFLSALFVSPAYSLELSHVFKTEKGKIKVTSIAQGLKNPWAMAFLPDGRILVSERPGNLRIVSVTGKISVPLKNVPAVYAEGQGGLLDVILGPDFEKSRMIYFTYAEKGRDGEIGTAAARAVLGTGELKEVEIIFRQNPKKDGGNHFGSRLAFAPDGMLFIGLGERYSYSEQAQNLATHLGKLVRIQPDGKVPDDNPYVGRRDALPEIWSYGHRNIQGMAVHPKTKKLWLHEHGPRGGDEINVPQAGGNYGWPEASYGSHYSYIPIEDSHEEQGFIEPIYHWTPSIAPSGMLFYTGSLLPEWEGDLFIGALAQTHLARLELEGQKVVHEEELLNKMEARIRDVTQGPDGAIYILTDAENGQILRLAPVK